MTRRIAFLSLLGLAGCATPQASPRAVSSDPDSVVITRLQSYFRTGPAYRLSISRDGRVTFESRLASDSGRRTSSEVDPQAARNLLAWGGGLRLDSLPPTLVGKAPYCSPVATDFPSVIIELYGPVLSYRFTDYLGCFETRDESPGRIIRQLRKFTTAVDSLSGLGAELRRQR